MCICHSMFKFLMIRLMETNLKEGLYSPPSLSTNLRGLEPWTSWPKRSCWIVAQVGVKGQFCRSQGCWCSTLPVKGGGAFHFSASSLARPCMPQRLFQWATVYGCWLGVPSGVQPAKTGGVKLLLPLPVRLLQPHAPWEGWKRPPRLTLSPPLPCSPEVLGSRPVKFLPSSSPSRISGFDRSRSLCQDGTTGPGPRPGPSAWVHPDTILELGRTLGLGYHP